MSAMHDIWLARALAVRPLTPEEQAQRKQLAGRPDFMRRRGKVDTELAALAKLPGTEAICQTVREKLRAAVDQAALGRYQTAFEMLEPVKHDVRAAIQNVKQGRNAALIEARKEIEAFKERVKAMPPSPERSALWERGKAILAPAIGDVSGAKILEAATALRALVPGLTITPSTTPERKGVAQRLRDIGVHYQKVRRMRGFGTEAERLFNEADARNRAGDEAAAHTALDDLDKLIYRAFQQGERSAPRKMEEQSERFKALRGTLGGVSKGYMADGMSASYAAEKLNPGKEFNLFLTQLRTFEKQRTPKNLDLVEASAKLYLKHYDSANAWSKSTKESLRKKNICETTLKGVPHWRLAFEFEQLGEPPWDDVKESKAVNLHARVLFEDATAVPRNPTAPTSRSARPLAKPEDAAPGEAAAGVNAVWVLEAPDWDKQNKRVKSTEAYVFKPLDSEAPVPGFPQGGSTAREVLGKAIGSRLEDLLDLNLGVPETSLVTIPNDKLPSWSKDEAGNSKLGIDPTKPPQRVGSMQAWSKNKGPLEKQLKNPEFLKKIPPEECQKMALLDLVSLNLDRHDRNFLIGQENDDQPPRLLPIDHGLILPSRGTLSQHRSKIGFPHGVLTQLPGSDEMFSPEMLEKIEGLDPDAVAEGLTGAVESLGRTHPDAKRVSEVGEEQIRLVKRSTRFLKQAAAAGLTLNEIYDAYGEQTEKIFDSSDEEAEQRFAEAIQSSRERSQGRKAFEEFWKSHDPDEIKKKVQDLGWGLGGDLAQFCVRNPLLVVKVLRIDPRKPTLPASLSDVPGIENPAVLATIARLTRILEDRAPTKIPKFNPKSTLKLKLERLQEEVENLQIAAMGAPKVSAGAREDVQDFVSLGGADKLAESGRGDLTYPANVEELRRQRTTELLAGRPVEDLLAELRKAIPEESIASETEKQKKLLLWLEYQRLGGNDEFYRLGGRLDGQTLRGRLDSLRKLKALDQGGLEAIPPEPEPTPPTPPSGPERPPSPALKERTPPPRPSVPGLPGSSLKLADWREARRIALNDPAPGRLHTDNYRPVEKALAAMETAKAAFEGASGDGVGALLETYVQQLRTTKLAVAAYVPRNRFGERHAPMAEYARDLGGMLDMELTARTRR